MHEKVAALQIFILKESSNFLIEGDTKKLAYLETQNSIKYIRAPMAASTEISMALERMCILALLGSSSP